MAIVPSIGHVTNRHRWDVYDPPEFLADEAAGRVIDQMRFRDIDSLHLPKPLTNVTLSGSLTNSGGAYLELNSPSGLDGETGLIDYYGGGELYVHLPGARAGASYLGQLRCWVEPVYGQEHKAYIACNVFGGKGGNQQGRLMYQQAQMVVPFFLPEAASVKPWIAFHPSAMRHWRVYDVSIKKI